MSIFRYNLGMYIASMCAFLCMAALLWFVPLPRAIVLAGMGAMALIVFWTVSSLLVSYYVYDLKRVTRWRWMPERMSFPPRRWLNVHAGLDESTPVLEEMFGDTDGMVVDIYDGDEMTEPSIARARRIHGTVSPAVIARLDALPLPPEDRDTVFVLFAAHEVRTTERRRTLLREIARVMQGRGQLVLVEHLRDWKNFLAFLHFFSRADWLDASEAAGLHVALEGPVTPFVRCFVMRKAGQ